jgi:hypothetical protein
MRDDYCENCGFDADECACCPKCGEFDGCECELEDDERCPDCGNDGMVCTCYDDADLEDLDDLDDDDDIFWEDEEDDW